MPAKHLITVQSLEVGVYPNCDTAHGTCNDKPFRALLMSGTTSRSWGSTEHWKTNNERGVFTRGECMAIGKAIRKNQETV